MTNKPTTTQKTPKKATTTSTTPAKAPTKPKVKRSYNKNTKVASEAKMATNVAKAAASNSIARPTEQYAEPTVEELKAGQLNLTKLLMVSNEKLNKALNDIDKITQDFMDLKSQSWWAITKERFSYTLKSWVMMF